MVFVYILECSDWSFYTGMTYDLIRRYQEHQDGICEDSYTASRRPVKLLYYETYKNARLAREREKQIKRWSRAKKKALIDGNIPSLEWHAKAYMRRRFHYRIYTSSYASYGLGNWKRNEMNQRLGFQPYF